MIPRFPGDPPVDLSRRREEVKIRVDKPLPPDIGQAEAKRDDKKASKAGGQR